MTPDTIIIFTNGIVQAFHKDIALVDYNKWLTTIDRAYVGEFERKEKVFKLLEAEPTVYISKWKKWSHKLNIKEALLLLGFDKEVYDYIKEKGNV